MESPAWNLQQLEILQSAADILHTTLLDLLRRHSQPPADSTSRTRCSIASSPANATDNEHTPESSSGGEQASIGDISFATSQDAQEPPSLSHSQDGYSLPSFESDFSLPTPEFCSENWPVADISGLAPSATADYVLDGSSHLFDVSGDLDFQYTVSDQSHGHDTICLDKETTPNSRTIETPIVIRSIPPFSQTPVHRAQSLGAAAPRKRSSPANDVEEPTITVEQPPRGNKRRRRGFDPDCQGQPRKIRSKNTCVRCKMQKVECIPHPSNPTGQCKRCRHLTKWTIPLPCLWYRIPDSQLFRPGSTLPHYSGFNFSGSDAGRLPFSRPVSGSETWIKIAQGSRPPVSLRMRRFVVSADDQSKIEPWKLPLYSHDFELANAGEAAQAFIRHLNESLYLYVLDEARKISDIRAVLLEEAMKTAKAGKTVVRDVLVLWASCRLSEGNWQIVGENTLGLDQGQDKIPLTPLLNGQLTANERVNIIGPLTAKILKRLESHVLKNKRENFFETFLCFFILLHNCETIVARQYHVARRRQHKNQYTNMAHIRAIHSCANTTLAYFHYACGGPQPFCIDWSNAEAVRPFEHLSDQQKKLLWTIKDFAAAEAETLNVLTHSHNYHKPFWFIGQMFEREWKPRLTLEHAPPAFTA